MKRPPLFHLYVRSGVEMPAPGDAVVDRYLLRIRPRPESSPRVVKSTSRRLAYRRGLD